LCVAVTCRPNIVFYSDQSVYKITLKALIQILKFYNTKPTYATNIFGTRSTHTQLMSLTIASRILCIPCISQLLVS
jgi:hypothetical protein